MENISEIIDIAKNCLNCRHRPCQNACPMKTQIPDFIAKIKMEKFDEAYDILLENNIFSNICSTICPQEDQCEGSCVRGIKGEPMPIGRLERFVNQWAKENNYTYKMNTEKYGNKKVAIIGSGPAGISCAIDLARNGIASTIFEKGEKIGGILRYGIPDFRLSKNALDNLIENVENMGIEMKTNKELGKDISIESLKEDGYDAIFLGIGAEKPTTYKLADEQFSSVYKSDDFLKKYNEGKYIKNLGTTVVIGGGNVAMDCSRSAVKMGAEKVYVLYRRARENMPARDIEVEEAMEDGVEFNFQTKVISASGKNNKLSQIECIKTIVEDGKAVDVEGSNFSMDIDTIVFAIGLTPNSELLEKQGIELEHGLIKIDEFGMTNVSGVFAGGDVTESKSTVCRAVAAGRKAAIGIKKYIEE